MKPLDLRKIDYNWTIYLYLLSGILLGLTANGWLANSTLARYVGALFPVLRLFSNSSINPPAWISYFASMVAIYLVFVPLAAMALAREVKSRPITIIPAQLAFLLFCAALAWVLLIGIAAIWENGENLPISSTGRGAAIGQALLNYRIGLALLGSAYMATVFVLLTIAFIAVPIAIYKILASAPSRVP